MSRWSPSGTEILIGMTRMTRGRSITVERGQLRTGDRLRSFLTVRGRPDPGRSPALVLVLHGTLQTAASIRSFAGFGFDTYAAQGAAVVVYPDAVRRDWNGARAAMMVSDATRSVDDVGFLRALARHTVERSGADPDRVFVIGFSLGGQMTIRLVHEAPELLAGAALIGATLPAPENRRLDRDARTALPVLTVHGTADPLAPYAGGIVGYRGRFGRGHHLSARDTAQYFAARNGITAEPEATPVPDRPGRGRSTSVTRHDWTAPGAEPVRMFTVHGGGHVIPNPVHAPAPWFFGPSTRAISAAEVIGEFFHISPTISPTEGSS